MESSLYNDIAVALKNEGDFEGALELCEALGQQASRTGNFSSLFTLRNQLRNMLVGVCGCNTDVLALLLARYDQGCVAGLNAQFGGNRK
jgi:hypothetical protein